MADFFDYNANGVIFKGFPDVKSSLETAWKATFGDEIDLTPDSPDGHHVDLEAKTVSSVIEGV